MKTTIKIRTHFNTKPYPGKKYTMPSKTVQGEAFTIKELMLKAAIQGHFPLETFSAQYRDVDNIDEINNMYKMGLDLVDLDEHREHLENLQETVDKAILDQKSKEALKQAKAKETAAKEATDAVSDSKQSDSEPDK